MSSKHHVNTPKVSFQIGRFVSMSSIYELMCNLANLMKLQKERPVLTSQFDVNKTIKSALKCNAVSFGPVSQLWFATLKSMCASKPQRCVQQH